MRSWFTSLRSAWSGLTVFARAAALLGLAALVIAGIVVVQAIGDGDPNGDDETATTVTRPTVILPDCPAAAAERPEAWPLALPAGMVITDYEVDGGTYRVTGVTNDAEALLDELLEATLADYEVDEPEGEAAEISVGFRTDAVAGRSVAVDDPQPVGSTEVEGRAYLVDGDGDGCWDTTVEIVFPAQLSADELLAIEDGFGVDAGDDSAGDGRLDGQPSPSPDDPLLQTVGSGTATTARGSFPLRITTCELQPVDIEASSTGGSLVVEADGPRLVWTYPDGTEVATDAARVVLASDTSGLITGDGEGPAGPETVLVQIDCPGG